MKPKSSKWREGQCDEAIREVVDMAREFHPQGYLNLHAVSQVCFELACQRNALRETLDEVLRDVHCEGRINVEHIRGVLEKCK